MSIAKLDFPFEAIIGRGNISTDCALRKLLMGTEVKTDAYFYITTSDVEVRICFNYKT